MPNWCMNNVTITGPIEKLEQIEEAINKNQLFEYLSPIGEWDYGKALENWGCKWEANEVDYEIDTDSQTMTLNFDTPWGPPIAAYQAGETKHGLSIEATFYESGMAFVGCYEDMEEETFSVDFEDEDWRDNVPSNLVEDWGLDDEYENWKEWQEDDEDA
jgi:hypothetical protein